MNIGDTVRRIKFPYYKGYVEDLNHLYTAYIIRCSDNFQYRVVENIETYTHCKIVLLEKTPSKNGV